MRLSCIPAILFCFLLLIPSQARSDELSDLKKQIEELQSTMDTLKQKVKELEEKQAEGEEVVSDLENNVDQLSGMPAQIMEQIRKGVSVGGHLKFYMLDRTDGRRNDVDQNNNISAGIHDLYLYFNKTLTDWLSLSLSPKIQVLASATPRLGGDISRTKSSSIDTDIDEAYMSLRLPWEVEARVGLFYPMFSEEYARQSWWHEQYHGNNGLLDLESWRSAGVELYKTFEFESFSLPVYFYPYLNGDNEESRFVDNNGVKSVLLHVAPEFFLLGGRLRLLGSFGWGRWDAENDNDAFQYLGGLEWKYRSIGLLGEYLRREQRDFPLLEGGVADAVNEGYYIRLMYTFNPTWRVLAKYSDVDLFFPSTTELTDNYKTLSFALNYWITDSSTIIPQIELVDAERSDGSESLEYIRWTLGWRTTF